MSVLADDAPKFASVLLDSVATRGSGHTPTKKRPDYWGGSIRWVSLKDSSRLDKGLILDTAESITERGLAHSSAVVHSAGSVVLLRDAGIGKSAILGSDMAVSQHFMAWRCGARLDNWYLYYYLQKLKPEFERISNGSTIKTIGLPYFRQLAIPLPPLAQQQVVSRALKAADDSIAALEQQIVKKRAIKQGMIQQLLTGKTRLPGFTEPWVDVRLGEIGQSLIGLTYRPDNVKRSGVLVLRSSNIQGERLVLDDNVYVDSPIPDKIRIRENDVLICVRNGSRRLIGKSVILDSRVAGQTFGAFMAVFRSRVNPFLQYFFQSDGFKRQIDEHLGATINQITNGSLNGFIVKLPSPAEQRAIVDRLQDTDRLIATLERLIDKRLAVKQGMMQQLLTGRTCLPVEAAS